MMGNENPTKKAEICGDRIRFIWTIHCIATVSMCASLTMMHTCQPSHIPRDSPAKRIPVPQSRAED